MLKVSELKKMVREFPSPYGVSFILIYFSKINLYFEISEFPSPYGVSFILMKVFTKCYTLMIKLCFRLLTEYHSFLLEKYIFKDVSIINLSSFRLLTEYHSFL